MRRVLCCFSCRELYESGLRAFVSFVHFYYKHECKLIFQPKSKLLLRSEGRGGGGRGNGGGGMMLSSCGSKATGDLLGLTVC